MFVARQEYVVALNNQCKDIKSLGQPYVVRQEEMVAPGNWLCEALTIITHGYTHAHNKLRMADSISEHKKKKKKTRVFSISNH